MGRHTPNQVFKCRVLKKVCGILKYSAHEFISSLLTKLFLSSSFIFGRMLRQECVLCFGSLFAISGPPQGEPDQAPVQLDHAGSRMLSHLETLDARVDHYIKCQWSAKQGGHRDAYYLLALWKCESLFRLRAWPRGLIALIPIYKKSTNNSISSVTSVHSDENYNACISFTHSTKVGGF